MKFLIEIDAGGVAFEEEPALEVADMLEKLVPQMRADAPHDFAHGLLFDSYGRQCGTWKWEAS